LKRKKKTKNKTKHTHRLRRALNTTRKDAQQLLWSQHDQFQERLSSSTTQKKKKDKKKERETFPIALQFT
jgi:hypothetical protein